MADPIKTVADFLDRLEGLPALPRNGLRCFRGSRNSEWELEPGILRADRKRLLTHERDAVRELIAVRPTDFASDQSMFDRLVRMQHFELPTRLLDVTTNPLVALYFATAEVDSRLEGPTDGQVISFTVPAPRRKFFDSDTISCIANLANLSNLEKKKVYDGDGLSIDKFNELPAVDRLLQFIRIEKPHFRPKIKREELARLWFVVPKLNNARIIAQSGAFIIYGLMPLFRKAGSGEAIKSEGIDVDVDSKKTIRDELRKLGIDQRSLFPEIDKAASYIVEQYS